MRLFTTSNEFQKQLAIANVKKSETCICVSAGAAQSRILTWCCQKQILHHLLVILSMIYSLQSKKLDLNPGAVKYVSCYNKAKRKPPCFNPSLPLCPAEESAAKHEKGPAVHQSLRQVSMLRPGKVASEPWGLLLMILGQGRVLAWGIGRKGRKESWGTLWTAPSSREASSGNVPHSLSTDCKNHRG